MSFEYTQDSYFAGAAYYQQHLDTVPLDQNGFYEASPHALAINIASPSYTSALMGDQSSMTYSDWDGGSIEGTPISAGDFSPVATEPERKPSTSDPSTRPNPRRPSAEAVARRRKQNRVSQAAWRARNKELVEELRQEITEHAEYNESMHETMKSLLQTTESLKGAIESALAAHPPKRSSPEFLRTDTGEAQLMSPSSCTNEGSNQDCDGESVKET